MRMDTQNCVICQSLLVISRATGADPGHDLDENGPLFLNLSKILLESSTNCDFDFNEFKSLAVNVNGKYSKRKICSTCHQHLYHFDALTGQLNDLQLKINEISAVIRSKAVQSQLFRKGYICSPTPTDDSGDSNSNSNGNLEVESTFDDSANNDDIMPDFDFNFDSIEDHGVNEKDAKVDIKIESSSTSTSTLNLTSAGFQLQLIGPHVIEENDIDLDLTSKLVDVGSKKIKICLEPIQLPSTNGPYNIKDLEIANFIQRDRERIKKYKRCLRYKRYNRRRRVARASKKNPDRKVPANSRERPKNTVVSSGVRDFICTYENCSKSFFTKNNYEDHLRIHTGERPFICEFCATTFRSEPLLKSHFTRIHNNSDRRKFKCPESSCGVYCNSQTRLDQHVLQSHKGGLKKYLCEQCPKSFNEISVLNDHIKCTHKGEFYNCPHPNCKSKLTSNYSLNFHIQKVHEKADRYFCSESGCKKGFFIKSDRDRHIKTHLGESSYEFACDYGQCTRRFMIKKSLEIHKMMVHLNERPYKCSTCPKAFARPKALEEHEILHTGRRDFICTYENCGQAYAIKSLLGEHIRKHHKNPDKWLSKNVQNRKGFRRRVNRVEIIKDLNDTNQNQIQKE